VVQVSRELRFFLELFGRGGGMGEFEENTYWRNNGLMERG
jgi:hypothetical protein